MSESEAPPRLFVPTGTKLSAGGIVTEAFVGGAGQTLLYLHPGDGLRAPGDALDALAQRFRVIAPVHPGFGNVPLPADFQGIDDLAYFYLDLIEAIDINDAVLVGASFGGWLALEIAVRSAQAFSHLVLIDSLGVKIGAAEDRDIADIFTLSDAEVRAGSYHDPIHAVSEFSHYDADELSSFARSREALAFYGWQPYMHNPGLKRWLPRIGLPTLVLWGAEDRIATPDYGRALAAALPNARFEVIAGAGHYPQIERPDAVARAIGSFIS